MMKKIPTDSDEMQLMISRPVELSLWGRPSVDYYTLRKADASGCHSGGFPATGWYFDCDGAIDDGN